MKNNYQRLILNNPELTRNLWIEFNSTRLLLMPLILGLFLILLYSLSENFADAVIIFSTIMFNIIVFIWGSKLSADSVIGEINERTWDNQVLSLISPWQMTIGKLFGATAYAWYGGLILIILNFIASFFVENTFTVLKNSLTNIFIAISVHAVIISLTLIGIKKNRFKTKLNSTLYFLVGLFIAWYMGSSTSMFYLFENTKFEGLLNLSKTIIWHNIPFEISDFILLSSIAFLIWSFLGLYRNFKSELSYPSGFSIWFGFLIFIIIYTSGFSSSFKEFFSSKDLFLLGLFIAYFSILSISYFSMFIESKHIIDYKKLFNSIRLKNIKEINNLLPLWVISSLLSLVLAIITFLYSFIGLINGNEKNFFDFSIFLPVNILLFYARDLCFVHYINFTGKFKKPDFASFVFIFLAYSLLPGIILLFDLVDFIPLFFPFAESKFFNGTLPILLQAILIFYLMRKKYKSSLNKI